MASAAARVVGRKPKLGQGDVKKAAAMLRDPTVTKTEVAQHFGVTRMTLNKALDRNGYSQNPAETADNAKTSVALGVQQHPTGS